MTACVSNNRRASLLYPIRIGIPARNVMSAASKAFCKRMVASKLYCFKSLARRNLPKKPLWRPSPSYINSRSICSLFSKTGATQGLAKRLIWVFGKPFRIVRTAGVVITASPIQFAERIRSRSICLKSISLIYIMHRFFGAKADTALFSIVGESRTIVPDNVGLHFRSPGYIPGCSFQYPFACPLF